MSIELKVIRTAEQYKAYLEHVEVLMDADTSKDQEAKDRLDLLCLLIQDYESKNFGGVSKSMLTLNEAIIDVKKG